MFKRSRLCLYLCLFSACAFIASSVPAAEKVSIGAPDACSAEDREAFLEAANNDVSPEELVDLF
jgi:hypothetical protein